MDGVTREPRPDHPAALSLRKPSQQQTGREFVRAMVNNYLVFNNSYALKFRTPGAAQVTLKHIPAQREETFIANVLASLAAHGVLIVGMPSLESQAHASPQSKEGHVNCKSGPELKALLEQYFSTVFLFSMNDEVVHTGFGPMAHYLIAMCVTPRNKTRS